MGYVYNAVMCIVDIEGQGEGPCGICMIAFRRASMITVVMIHRPRGVTEVLPCVFKYLNLVSGSVVFTDGVGTVH